MFNNIFDLGTNKALDGKFEKVNVAVKSNFNGVYNTLGKDIQDYNKDLRSKMIEAAPADHYNFLRQIDSIMIASLAILDEKKGNKESSQYIYPALWEEMRKVLAEYVQTINTSLETAAACLVEAMIVSDKIDPIQAKEDRPELTEEEKEKEMINCNPPELPNVMKNPMETPDDKIIEVFYKYRIMETVEEKIDTAVEDAIVNIEEMLNNKINDDVKANLKAAFKAVETCTKAAEENIASLTELNVVGVDVNKEIKCILEISESAKLDPVYDNLIQATIWTLFSMPIPMQRYYQELMQMQQQMEMQQMMQNQQAVAGKADAPAGKKGPGSLRVMK